MNVGYSLVYKRVWEVGGRELSGETRVIYTREVEVNSGRAMRKAKVTVDPDLAREIWWRIFHIQW
jgi:hypothetical protein